MINDQAKILGTRPSLLNRYFEEPRSFLFLPKQVRLVTSQRRRSAIFSLKKDGVFSMSTENWISERSKRFDASGIRRMFDLAAKLENPINLSIGQPDFDVPEACLLYTSPSPRDRG